MNGLYEFVQTAFSASLFASVPASLLYLVLIGVRRRHSLAGRSLDATVRFEAIWGMALALPALFLVVGGALEPGAWGWWWPPLLIAVAALYTARALALAGRGLSAPARWYRAAVGILITPRIVVLFAVSPDVDAGYLILVAAFVSRLGIAYVADCLVGVRFARAVGRRQSSVVANVPHLRQNLRVDARG